jgi:hypothetical protein
MKELREQCLLGDYFWTVHDIFVKYARRVVETSESYVDIIMNSPGKVVRYPKARTMCVDHLTTQVRWNSKEKIHVDVEPQTKALFVSCTGVGFARLYINGHPSSLVHFALDKVDLVN